VVAPQALQLVNSGLPSAPRPPGKAEARRHLGLPTGSPVAAWIGRHHRAKRPEDLAPLAERLLGTAQVVALAEGLAGSAEGDAFLEAGGRIVEGEDPASCSQPPTVLVMTSAGSAPLLRARSNACRAPGVGLRRRRPPLADRRRSPGFLIRPFDLAEFVRRVTLLVEDPALGRGTRRRRKRRLATRFSYQAMVRAIDGVYPEAVA
jgi:hypothetical protein